MSDPTPQSIPIKATCHCTAITLTLTRAPYTTINECQCSICRRYGAAWAYYKTGEVEFTKKEGKNTRTYLWAGKTIEFHFCEECGCCLCWWPTELFPPGYDEVGVNTRMMEPEVLRGLNRKVTYEYS